MPRVPTLLSTPVRVLGMRYRVLYRNSDVEVSIDARTIHSGSQIKQKNHSVRCTMYKIEIGLNASFSITLNGAI